jgi:hypothetical protein
VRGLSPSSADLDLAMPGTGDLAMSLAPDLAAAPDLASTMPPDLAMSPPPDLAIPPDLSMCNPPSIGATVGPGPNLAITLSNVKINGGTNFAHLNPGVTFSVSADYSITDNGGNNVDQIIVGIAPNSPQDCLFNGTVKHQTRTGNGTATLTAPTAPGTYTLRFHYGQATSCDPSGWWSINGAPTAAEDFAAFCVP